MPVIFLEPALVSARLIGLQTAFNSITLCASALDIGLFAASFNNHIILVPKLRNLYEGEQLGGRNLLKLCVKHFAALKERKFDVGEPLSVELRDEARSDTDRLERIEAATVALQSKLAEWSLRFQMFKRYAIYAIYAVVIVIVLARVLNRFNK